MMTGIVVGEAEKEDCSKVQDSIGERTVYIFQYYFP